ncbi:unnamed protein product [Phytomonas sp. EM1]|nr:unnamed protein product [Phytomonas sp. EM1]|eukprot:CCW62321.1 unnamed protein product [Phytomonas sp. isolate EM1]
MSFYFNWGRLDETAAEAIRVLINDKLKQILYHRRNAMNVNDSCVTIKVNSSTSGLGGVNSSLEGNRPRNRAFNVDAEHGGSGARAGLAGPSAVVNLSNPLHTTSMDPSSIHKTASFSNDSAANGDARYQTPQCFGRHSSQGMSATPPVSTMGAAAGGVALNTCAPPPKIPLISFLRIDNIQWGTMPPFIEIDRFENALDIFDTTASCGLAASLNISSPGLGLTVGQMDRPLWDSYESTEVPQTACPSSTQVPPRDLTQHGKAPISAVGTSDAASMTTAQESVDGANTISSTRATEEGRGLSTKGSALSHLRGARATSPQTRPAATTLLTKIKTPYNYSEHEFPTPSSTPIDTLAPFLGTGGLHIRLHLTYGGSMSFSASTAIQYCFHLGSFSLPVSMPIELHVSDFDLDCFVCFNFHHNECRLWLEPGKLADSAINRLKVVAVFGERKDTEDDFDTSPAEYLRGKVGRPDDDDGSIFVDRREVEQLFEREVKKFLQKKLMAPHFITIPIQISG